MSDEAIQASAQDLDGFVELVIRPRFARTRWLAMTGMGQSHRGKAAQKLHALR